MGMVMQWDAISEAEADLVRQLDGDGFMAWLEAFDRPTTFDVDKGWHAVHFTLVGTSGPAGGPDGDELADVVLGGEEFGDDVGYGPPRWIAPGRVAALAERLTALDPVEFAARVDLDALDAHDVYPNVWGRSDERAENAAWVSDCYATIRDGFVRAAAERHGFVVSLL